MANLQKTLESLQPYVIGIRYLQGTTLVDVVLTEGWTLPEDSKITRTKGDESMNYHMIHSDASGIGLDELLAYVDKTIKMNLDREKKHELLKIKVNELKEIFKKNPLNKLQRLKFTFGEEDFMTSMSDIDIEDMEETHPPTPVPIAKVTLSMEEYIEPPFVEESIITSIPMYLDEEGKSIEMTEEEKELVMEEARAERNLKILESRKQKTPNQLAKKVELPPKRKPVVANEMSFMGDCECGENEACEKCINNKDY